MSGSVSASAAQTDRAAEALLKLQAQPRPIMHKRQLRGFYHELSRGYVYQHHLTWYVGYNDMGYRCGYVRVPHSHPWFGVPAEDIDAQVHGGLTFCGKGPPMKEPKFSYGWWLGFDCGHGWDAFDPELIHPEVRKAYKPIVVNGEVQDVLAVLGRGGVIRSTAYVEAECMNLCAQAIEAKQGIVAGESLTQVSEVLQ